MTQAIRFFALFIVACQYEGALHNETLWGLSPGLTALISVVGFIGIAFRIQEVAAGKSLDSVRDKE